MIYPVYCYACESRHAPPVSEDRGVCPNPKAAKFCRCGHKLDDCAPERCSHEYARDALWGNA